TVVPLQDKLPVPSYSFTLSFFSYHPLDTAAAESGMRHYTETQGAWTRRTAGGNTGSPKYGCNPQFSIAVSTATPLSLLFCPDTPIPCAVVGPLGAGLGFPLAPREFPAFSKE